MSTITPEFAEVIGLLCAEGSYINRHYSYWGNDRNRRRFYKNHKSERIEFSNKDQKLIQRFQNLLIKEFGYATKPTKHFKVNICKRAIIRVITSQTELGHLKWCVPTFILSSSDSIKIAFIRGYFDGDGTVSNNIRFFSTNNPGLKQVFILLKDLGFRPYFEKPMIKEKRKPLYVIHIRRNERESFLSLIKPVSKKPGNAGVILKQTLLNP